MHIYGVVVDASFPHKSFKTDKFICSLKITDASMGVDERGIAETCSLVLFAKKFEDLPNCSKVGDIIRVHRATVGFYKSKKQFTANIFFNSSWALFHSMSLAQFRKKYKKGEEVKQADVVGEKDYLPYQFFGKTFSFEKDEQKLIKGMRMWVENEFAKNLMLSS